MHRSNASTEDAAALNGLLIDVVKRETGRCAERNGRMAKIPEMTKHRGFPAGLSGTQWQFTLRRANAKVTVLGQWRRHPTLDKSVGLADTAFVHSLWHYFGTEPFERGNLDGERLSRLFGREILPAERDFDPASYQALLKLNEPLARKNFPDAFVDVLDV